MKSAILLGMGFSTLLWARGADPEVVAQKSLEKYLALMSDSALVRGNYGEFFMRPDLERLSAADRAYLSQMLLRGGANHQLKSARQGSVVTVVDGDLPSGKLEIDFRDILRDPKRPLYLNGQRYESAFLTRSSPSELTGLKQEVDKLKKFIFKTQAGLSNWLEVGLKLALLPLTLLSGCTNADGAAANTGVALTAVDAEYRRYLPANYREKDENFDGRSRSLEHSTGDEDPNRYYLPSSMKP